MERICGVYKITNPIGEVYIGQTTNFRKRITGHKCCKKLNTLISKSINFYGFDNHIIEIIEEIEKEKLLDRERFWQDYYSKIGPILNTILTKGNGMKGSVRVIQVEAMRRANIGSIKAGMHSEEYKAKMSIRLKGNRLNKTANKKPIIQYDLNMNFIKEWECLSYACKELKINIGNTGDCALGNRNQSAGFKWKYKN